MHPVITDLALDLGVFALDYEIENARAIEALFASPSNYTRQEPGLAA